MKKRAKMVSGLSIDRNKQLRGLQDRGHVPLPFPELDLLDFDPFPLETNRRTCKCASVSNPQSIFYNTESKDIHPNYVPDSPFPDSPFPELDLLDLDPFPFELKRRDK